MKIALMTIYYATNYGAALQTFATQKLLSRYGDVSLINYKSLHLIRNMRLFRIGPRPKSILWAIKDLYRVFPRYRLIQKFKFFIEKYFNKTDEYKHIDEISSLDGKFDVFVSGSDQIWNPKVIDDIDRPTGKLDAAYLLGFVKKSKKISFSSSYGSYSFSEEEQIFLKKYLESYSHLSVREGDAAVFLPKLLGGKPVIHVLDPTLVLTKQEWLDSFGLKQLKNHEDYIFVYIVRNTKDRFVNEVVDKVSRDFSMKVITIDQELFSGFKAERYIRDAGPIDFLELLSNAKIVITNSFHGTVFSVNFSVPFISVKPGSGLNRIESFLQSVGLSGQLVMKAEDIDQTVKAAMIIDFEDAHKKLDILRQASIQYLEKAIYG